MEMSADDHITLAALFEHARLKGELQPAALSHLGICETCRTRLSWMAVATSMGAEEAVYEPPQSVMDKVLRLGRSTSTLRQMRNAIVALLTFDSFSDPAPVGVRHAEAGPRQMTYESDGIEVGIWLRKSEPGKLTVAGQVSDKSSGPIQDASAHVDVVVDGDHIRTTSLSAWGEFVFDELPSTECSLQVFLVDRLLQIPLPAINGERS